MVLTRVKIGSPVFFSQERTGQYMKRFNIIKFRTMTDERDVNGNYISDEMRHTGFGDFLRSTSLDELPELLLIVEGEMSIIGPRPLLPEYDPYYTEYERKRFNVRCGLIPPDSVDQSAIISWDKQLQYEADYANEVSFENDLRILLGVFKMLFKRRNTDYGKYIRKTLSEERKAKKDIKQKLS